MREIGYTKSDKLYDYPELMACPFCGGEAQIARTMHMGMRTYRFFAVCLVCGAEMPRTSRTMAQAAEAWNRRADNG